MVIDAHSIPLTSTYPKRAKQIVKQGRAEWVDENTIRMLASSPDEMRAKDMPDEATQMVHDTDIQVGDVVCINSGGPGMTVMEIRDDGLALCKWWSGMRPDYSQEWLPLKAIRRKELQKD